MHLLYFSCKPLQVVCQKKGDFFSKKFSTPDRPNFPISLPPNIPNRPNFPNLPISPNKKSDISFLLRKLLKISDFDYSPKIGFLFFHFFPFQRQFKILFAQIFYSPTKFFVKSLSKIYPRKKVIHTYFFPAQPNISLNAPARRSKTETFCAPV